MTNKTPVDKETKVIRFGCGAMLGALLCFSLALKAIHHSFGAFGLIVIILITSGFFGYLAMKQGDRFWHDFIDSRWWRWW